MTEIVSISNLIQDLSTRSGRAILSQLGLRSPTLRKYMASLYAREPGEPVPCWLIRAGSGVRVEAGRDGHAGVGPKRLAPTRSGIGDGQTTTGVPGVRISSQSQAFSTSARLLEAPSRRRAPFRCWLQAAQVPGRPSVF